MNYVSLLPLLCRRSGEERRGEEEEEAFLQSLHEEAHKPSQLSSASPRRPPTPPPVVQLAEEPTETRRAPEACGEWALEFWSEVSQFTFTVEFDATPSVDNGTAHHEAVDAARIRADHLLIAINIPHVEQNCGPRATVRCTVYMSMRCDAALGSLAILRMHMRGCGRHELLFQ